MATSIAPSNTSDASPAATAGVVPQRYVSDDQTAHTGVPRRLPGFTPGQVKVASILSAVGETRLGEQDVGLTRQLIERRARPGITAVGQDCTIGFEANPVCLDRVRATRSARRRKGPTEAANDSSRNVKELWSGPGEVSP